MCRMKSMIYQILCSVLTFSSMSSLLNECLFYTRLHRLLWQVEYERLNKAVNPMLPLRSASSLMFSRVDLLYLWKVVLTPLLWQKHSDFWVCDVYSCTLADGWSSFIRKWKSCSASVKLWASMSRVFPSGSSFASGSVTMFCTYWLVQHSNIYIRIIHAVGSLFAMGSSLLRLCSDLVYDVSGSIFTSGSKTTRWRILVHYNSLSLSVFHSNTQR